MKALHLFRVLAFQPHGKGVERGPQARGTLVLLESEDGKRSARFIRDIDGDILEMGIDSFEVIPAVPVNRLVVLHLQDKKTHVFTAYKELPPSEKTHFTVIKTGVNPVARYEV